MEYDVCALSCVPENGRSATRGACGQTRRLTRCCPLCTYVHATRCPVLTPCIVLPDHLHRNA
eukprot:428889-Rhodomonas_salina.1